MEGFRREGFAMEASNRKWKQQRPLSVSGEGFKGEEISSRRLVEDKLRTRRLVEACGGEGFENERREGKQIRARSVKMSSKFS